MKKLYGITTAMVTPFNQDGSVNYQSVAELTEFLVNKGVHCLYPLGTTGEMLRLSEAERKQVAETVIKANNGRATVYIHVGAMTQAETLSLARHAYESGADGIGVVTPAFFGVHCLYPLGTTGEMLRLSEAERKQVAETVIKANNGRATVYIHVGAMTQAETLSLARHAYESGADGIGVVTPAFFGANDREMESYFLAVTRAVPQDFPVYLYNIPQCAGNNLSADLAQRIAAQAPNVVGIKYSFPDYLTVNNYLAVNQHQFSVVVGADRLFLPALAMGCDGVVSGVSCAYPEPFLAVYDAFQRGDIKAAQQAQRKANQFCELLRNGSNMSYFKEALKYRGIAAGVMRAPQLDLPEAEISAFIESLSALAQQSGYQDR